MSCKIPPEIEEYMISVETDTPRACREQHALCAYVRRVFDTENIFVDTERLDKYIRLEKYTKFKKLLPWEKFLTALWLCTYKAPGLPRWDDVIAMLGRGSGKDGYIAYISMCLTSPYNPEEYYDVDICAMNEEQAMRPVTDFVEALELPENTAKLKKFYYHTKEKIKGYKNKGIVRGRTNNPGGKDGMRSGCIIFNEVHAYQNYDNIAVFTTGQGKTGEFRSGVFSSNGKVSDGPLDDYLKDGEDVLFNDAPDNGVLYFICRLDGKDEVHDPLNWTKASPSLYFLPNLQRKTQKEYYDWLKNPERNVDFMPKRMGLRDSAGDLAVTSYDNIKNTNKAYNKNIEGRNCVIGFDYAELNDWASAIIHFKIGEERIDINHTWICAKAKTLCRVKAPYREWAQRKLVTIVDDVSIDPNLITEWIFAMGRHYNIIGLAMDNFRWTLVASAFIKIGFDAKDKNRVKLIKPADIMKIIPTIETVFDRNLFYWGDNPVLRWCTNNTKRVRSSRSIGSDTGNFYYAKIEAKSRKTDAFMALVAAMCIEDKLNDTECLAEYCSMPGAVSL